MCAKNTSGVLETGDSKAEIWLQGLNHLLASGSKPSNSRLILHRRDVETENTSLPEPGFLLPASYDLSTFGSPALHSYLPELSLRDAKAD